MTGARRAEGGAVARAAMRTIRDAAGAAVIFLHHRTGRAGRRAARAGRRSSIRRGGVTPVFGGADPAERGGGLRDERREVPLPRRDPEAPGALLARRSPGHTRPRTVVRLDFGGTREPNDLHEPPCLGAAQDLATGGDGPRGHRLVPPDGAPAPGRIASALMIRAVTIRERRRRRIADAGFPARGQLGPIDASGHARRDRDEAPSCGCSERRASRFRPRDPTDPCRAPFARHPRRAWARMPQTHRGV